MKMGRERKIKFATKAILALARTQPRVFHIPLVYPMLAGALLMSACAAYQKQIVLDPVGPAPLSSASSASIGGSLMIYSFCESIPDLSAEITGDTSDNWEYSGYKIFAADGKLFKSVQNNAGTTSLHPQPVELPVGRYMIIAQSVGHFQVTVPVIIRHSQTTVLHLDGHDFWPEESGFNLTNTVHLPSGQIVGWRG